MRAYAGTLTERATAGNLSNHYDHVDRALPLETREYIQLISAVVSKDRFRGCVHGRNKDLITWELYLKLKSFGSAVIDRLYS
jgi:hypothetical protein